jgi:hypothetical protein
MELKVQEKERVDVPLLVSVAVVVVGGLLLVF